MLLDQILAILFQTIDQYFRIFFHANRNNLLLLALFSLTSIHLFTTGLIERHILIVLFSCLFVKIRYLFQSILSLLSHLVLYLISYPSPSSISLSSISLPVATPSPSSLPSTTSISVTMSLISLDLHLSISTIPSVIQSFFSLIDNF